MFWGDYMLYKTKVKEDEKIIKDLCEKLDKLIRNIVYINPSFIYIGSKEKGYYSIYNQNNYGKNTELSLNFRLYYPDKNSFLYHKDIKYLKGKDLNKYIEYKYNESNFLYVKIEWFSINPTGRGKGSRVISHFIDLLKTIDSIEFILLSPINNSAKRFWTTNKFVDEECSLVLDKRVMSCACKRLIYKL